MAGAPEKALEAARKWEEVYHLATERADKAEARAQVAEALVSELKEQVFILKRHLAAARSNRGETFSSP